MFVSKVNFGSSYDFLTSGAYKAKVDVKTGAKIPKTAEEIAKALFGSSSGAAGVELTVASIVNDNLITVIKMLISIIIPVYNEINTIIELLELIQRSPIWRNNEKDVIVIDDNSIDGTYELLLKNDHLYQKIFRHNNNLGKGAAVKTGIENFDGDVLIIQDADLEYDPNEYPNLIKPIEENKADVVYGSRFVGGRSHRVVYFWHMVGNKLLTLFSNIMTNINLTDMECCYKVFRREIIKKIRIQENRFGIEPELTAKVAKLNCRIYEVGISYYGRTYDEGKKIGIKDGFRALWCIIKYNIF